MNDFTKRLKPILEKLKETYYNPTPTPEPYIIKSASEDIEALVINIVNSVIGIDEPLLESELPDDNGQVLGTWATHRNKLKWEQHEKLKVLFKESNNV